MSFIVPPPSFEGTFAGFYERYVEPNLPSAEKVAAFDALLSCYLSQDDPLYVVRYVKGQGRGTICRNINGMRMLPTDNAPVWWLHAFLLSDNPLPSDTEADEFFVNIPHKFFGVTKFDTLNNAGFHAAHILDTKNGDTDWQRWTREELSRRMLLNIHPCNMFLVAKESWQQNGGRRDVILWLQAKYANRYGDIMTKFLSAVAEDPHYHYGASENIDIGEAKSKEVSGVAI